jgi:hypothetical protein
VADIKDGRRLGGNKPKTSIFGPQFVLFRAAALVAAQYARH